MPGIYQVRLTDAIFQVGPALTRLQGFGDDFFSLAPASDVGVIMDGAYGDVMGTIRESNAWIATINFLTASQGIDLLGQMKALRAMFPVNVVYGNFSLVGFGLIMNTGEVAAGLGATTRTMTMGIAKVSGNTDASPGTVLYVS